MKEKLIIRNFGPIKNVELDLGRFNVLIGDQGTGKSTVAKLYSLLKNFISIKFFNHEDELLEEDLNWQFDKYLKTFELESYLKADSFIFYYNSHLNIKVSYQNEKLDVVGLRYPIPSRIPRFTYIVAERVYVSILSDALYGINETGAKLPTLFNRFGNKFSTSKKEKSVRKYKNLIGIDFLHNDGTDLISLDNGDTLPLSLGSSGIQGTIPMLVVFDSIVEENRNQRINDENLLVIEEPELNLFPETQQKVLNYIIANNFLSENKKFKNQLLLTTHSPYILTSLNNLMYAYQVGQKHKEEVNNIVEEKYWVNPEEVSAYQLLSDGTCINILAKEEGMIESDKIDEVSRTLNEDFDKLQDIELGVVQND